VFVRHQSGTVGFFRFFPPTFLAEQPFFSMEIRSRISNFQQRLVNPMKKRFFALDGGINGLKFRNFFKKMRF
jgi:hypothetical protein